MIRLPNFDETFEYENNFYLSCDITRISKILSHYELFKKVSTVPGAIVECGVFKGISLSRFAMFRNLFGNPFSKKIIGFDTFDTFPQTMYEPDKKLREKFINEAGKLSISVEQMTKVLEHKGCNKFVELIPGDICETIPIYVKEHPELKISLLNLDVDIYEPSIVVLDCLYPRVEKGGIILLDDYGVFPGETKAVDDYFKDKDVLIQKLQFSMTPCYIIKKGKDER